MVVLKMPRSLFNMIFMVCFFLFASCKTQNEKIDFSIEKPEKVLLIYDSSDMYSSECVENARWAIKYAKVNYDELDL